MTKWRMLRLSVGTGACTRTRLHRFAPARQPAEVRALAVVLLLVAAACGNSGPSSAPKVIPTSSTTAEEARAIDGPVIRYQDASSASGGLSTLLSGVLQLEGNCLYLVQASLDQRFPILWPAGTRWDAANQSVISPAGEAIGMGDSVEARGGYFFLSDIHLLAGTAASNVAAQCLDGDQIAVLKNTADAITPKAPG